MCHQGRTPLSDCNKGDSNALEQDKNTDATKLGDAGNSRKLLMGTKTTTLLPEHPQPPSSCLASNVCLKSRLCIIERCLQLIFIVYPQWFQAVSFISPVPSVISQNGEMIVQFSSEGLRDHPK